MRFAGPVAGLLRAVIAVVVAAVVVAAVWVAVAMETVGAAVATLRVSLSVVLKLVSWLLRQLALGWCPCKRRRDGEDVERKAVLDAAQPEMVIWDTPMMGSPELVFSIGSAKWIRTRRATALYNGCLLYTSDAADDTPCVDL
eukprot:4471925-Pleurochrysis_carterae.AAC.6